VAWSRTRGWSGRRRRWARAETGRPIGRPGRRAGRPSVTGSSAEPGDESVGAGRGAPAGRSGENPREERRCPPRSSRSGPAGPCRTRNTGTPGPPGRTTPPQTARSATASPCPAAPGASSRPPRRMVAEGAQRGVQRERERRATRSAWAPSSRAQRLGVGVHAGLRRVVVRRLSCRLRRSAGRARGRRCRRRRRRCVWQARGPQPSVQVQPRSSARCAWTSTSATAPMLRRSSACSG
jgi:hypothetical protein